MSELAVNEAAIPGLYEVDLVLHGDSRGWFKENYQAEKLQALGLPEFNPIQNNFSYNAEKGVTRGIHAEPWNKFISLANGLVFVAIVDLRPGDTFGVTETFELSPAKALYVPSGCGNSYQTLGSDVTYTYLVDAHWYADAEYTFVDLADPELNIQWPIALDEAIISDKDLAHPPLSALRGVDLRDPAIADIPVGME